MAATYTWSVEPKLGLWVGAAGSSSGELNIGAPAPVGVATTGNADGNIDSGETLSVTFNQRMKASTLCSGWNTNTGNFSISGNNTNLAFTIGNNNAPGTSNDTVSISNGSTTCGTSAFGTFDLGSNGYVSATKNCTGNGGSAQGLSWSGATATMTLTFNSCTTSTVGASQIKYTPSTSAQNSSGTALLATATATSASVQQW